MAYIRDLALRGPSAAKPSVGLGRLLRGKTLVLARPALTTEQRRLRRAQYVWWLLFLDVLGAGPTHLLPLPHKVGQAITQGALWVALLLALTINPKVKLRRNLFLGLFSVLAVTTLMSSLRFVSVGTDYRAVRFVGFLVVLWLLTPWWGRKDLLLLRWQMRFLVIIVASVVIGLLLTPGSALATGRLSGALWPIASTQVAHYSAELTGLALLLWLCGLIGRWPALLTAVPSLTVLILTHTRTALVAMAAGFIVAAISLFAASRRVRRAFTASIIVATLVGMPLSPLIIHWMTRGENTQQLASLTGRTNFWTYVFSAPRPLTNTILGNGLSNGSVYDPSDPSQYGQGLPIDSSWVEDYQDQGIAGDFLTAIIFATLLLIAAFRPRGPARALALFLVVYCLVASFTEDGAGIVSQYLLDLTVAASLLALPTKEGGLSGAYRGTVHTTS